MSEVSVELGAVAGAIKQCRAVQMRLKSETSKMLQQYDDLGSGWNDEKYRELGQIVRRCADAFKQPLSELQRCDVYLQRLCKAIAEYDSITFVSSSEQRETVDETEQNIGLRTSNHNSPLLEGTLNRNGYFCKRLKGVEYRPIQAAMTERTPHQIISNISGGDMTDGSCSSLALTYAGNRAGYVVYDFRDGRSREVFSLRNSIQEIAGIPGVESVIERGTNDGECAERLIANMERGREYYMATGRHAAVVRMDNEGRYQYLELQSGVPDNNGWHPLTQRALYERFGCEDDHRSEWTNYLISLDSLQSNTVFLNLLGYINTDENSQVRGENGRER